MPIYLYRCEVCKGIEERYQQMDADAPDCCGVPMSKLPTCHALIKMKGMGGYPSLRKAIQGNSASWAKNKEPGARKAWV
jgi:predicted nucleic acid-binding Zn ribbon protein